MEPRAHHVLIGLFTLLAAASGLFFALWLNNSDNDRDYTWYEIIFDQGVSGLNEGSPVKYSGIRVGDVALLRLDPDDPRNVRALVRVFSHVPIRENTRAGLAITNITGSMSIELEGGTPDRPILEGSRSNPPLIHAEPSTLTSLVATGETLLGKLDQLLTNSNRVMSDQNIQNLTQSLNNLQELSAGLMERREEVNAVFERLKKITIETRSTLDTYQRVGNRAESLLDNEVQTFLGSASSATQTLEQSTARIDQLLARNEEALARGMQGVGELEPALRDMRTTLTNLNGLINRLEEDPAGLLLGKEPLQEFNP
ncbi:MlaD family protein [Marinobacter confluentis]|uniref:MCE family protein n=1 Tax=Marinobacter confluentis TaxID=1697557 RepID=A0A4Z1BUE7_9GAMM|nr:MlaD family protein [Marinobacter confluentis]TGN41735.1 MCE family protein [Marinobacter confluentis]